MEFSAKQIAAFIQGDVYKRQVIFVTYNFDRKVASTQDINYKTKYFFVYIPKAAVENLFQAATKVHL